MALGMIWIKWAKLTAIGQPATTAIARFGLGLRREEALDLGNQLAQMEGLGQHGRLARRIKPRTYKSAACGRWRHRTSWSRLRSRPRRRPPPSCIAGRPLQAAHAARSRIAPPRSR